MLTTLPFYYIHLQKNLSPQHLAPNVFKWLSGRVSGSEIQVNILWAVIVACICQVQYPERLIFLPGYSSTGKSTYFQLITALMPKELVYAVSPEAFSSDFGLEDFSDGIPKRVIIFHDIGATVSESFINTIRTLVSSSGETANKVVRRKNKRNATMHFFRFGISCIQ